MVVVTGELSFCGSRWAYRGCPGQSRRAGGIWCCLSRFGLDRLDTLFASARAAKSGGLADPFDAIGGPHPHDDVALRRYRGLRSLCRRTVGTSTMVLRNPAIARLRILSRASGTAPAWQFPALARGAQRRATAALRCCMLPAYAALACSRTTAAAGRCPASRFNAKSKRIVANGSLSPRALISSGSVWRTNSGISPSRVAKAKSS